MRGGRESAGVEGQNQGSAGMQGGPSRGQRAGAGEEGAGRPGLVGAPQVELGVPREQGGGWVCLPGEVVGGSFFVDDARDGAAGAPAPPPPLPSHPPRCFLANQPVPSQHAVPCCVSPKQQKARVRDTEEGLEQVAAELEQERAQHESATLTNAVYEHMLEYKEQMLGALGAAHEVGGGRGQGQDPGGGRGRGVPAGWRQKGLGFLGAGATSGRAKQGACV